MRLFEFLGVVSQDALEAATELSTADLDSRGAVFTRPEVANLLLNLVGYTQEAPLHTLHLLEPAAGQGAFLLAAIERLLYAYLLHGGNLQEWKPLLPAIRAFEVHFDTFTALKLLIQSKLTSLGISHVGSDQLCATWLTHGDYLLTPCKTEFEFIVGNPPYVRQEKIPPALLIEYRRRYTTMYDRADLYIPFFEKSLNLLSKNGILGFLCTNRWTKNRYGGPLRKLISKDFNLNWFIDLDGVDVFEQSVTTYPAITVISKIKSEFINIISASEANQHSISELGSKIQTLDKNVIHQYQTRYLGAGPWVIGADNASTLLHRLERDFSPIENTGCKVGIGVATGLDRVFINKLNDLPVEAHCKLPLAMAQDFVGNEFIWSGYGMVNPYQENGRLLDLEDSPKLKSYLEKHRLDLENRYCVRKKPQTWYRTIDRIDPNLKKMPKLLIPDIKGTLAVAYDEGTFYPHHNLYWITSGEWDLRALAILLSSSVALFFISCYCTKMSGGFFRFQAQYLKKICLPQWKDLPINIRKQLLVPGLSKKEIESIAMEIWALTDSEWLVIQSHLADSNKISREAVAELKEISHE